MPRVTDKPPPARRQPPPAAPPGSRRKVQQTTAQRYINHAKDMPVPRVVIEVGGIELEAVRIEESKVVGEAQYDVTIKFRPPNEHQWARLGMVLAIAAHRFPELGLHMLYDDGDGD